MVWKGCDAVMSSAMRLELNKAFQSFKIGAVCVNAREHRHFVSYDAMIKTGHRVAEIKKYIDEISLYLKTKSNLTCKLIPEEGVVRLQGTRGDSKALCLKELYKRERNNLRGFFPLVIGETDHGMPLHLDMSDNPHLLIAGTTGSGKSVLLHNLIYNALNFQNIDLYLVDPKRVEFSSYKRKAKVICNDLNATIKMLEKIQKIMEKRYAIMSRRGVNDLKKKPNLFSKILIVIDEVADLITDDKNNLFERLLVKIAQKSRACGIHIIVATQRPSVDILTGLIKANFPARIACRTSSRVDSQVIIDRPGAELLAGKGDAILISPSLGEVRFQSAYIAP
jgi:S-DNA-T family DNA segregation ATPase FtsK/SpoIIIE